MRLFLNPFTRWQQMIRQSGPIRQMAATSPQSEHIDHVATAFGVIVPLALVVASIFVLRQHRSSRQSPDTPATWTIERKSESCQPGIRYSTTGRPGSNRHSSSTSESSIGFLLGSFYIWLKIISIPATNLLQPCE